VLVLVPGKEVGSINITPVQGLWKCGILDHVPGMDFWLSLSLREVDFLSSALFLGLLLDGWSWNGWLFVFLLKGERVSSVLSPGISDGSPGAIGLNSKVVGTSDNTEET
jgi:hypothetical protein